MKFLIDHDVYAATVRFLKNLGHDVIPVAQIGYHQELEQILISFTEQELKQAFVVVEPGRHRFRKLPK